MSGHLTPVDRPRARTIRLRRRAATLAAATIAFVGSAGTAVAYWNVSGSGTGSAEVAEAHVSVGIVGVGGLFPGATQTLAVHVTNANPAPYAVTGLAPELSGLPAACPASAWTLSVPTLLPTVSATATADIPVTVAMLPGAPSSCQGANLSVPFTVTGTLR